MKCYACKSENIVTTDEHVTRFGVTLTMQGERCQSCGEVTYSRDEVRKHERGIASAIADRGIRTGKEFQFVRKVAGLLATELAELLDVRPETISRWERDESEIPRTTAYVLLDLLEHPRRTRERLAAFA